MLLKQSRLGRLAVQLGSLLALVGCSSLNVFGSTEQVSSGLLLELTTRLVKQTTCYNGPDIASEYLLLELVYRNRSGKGVTILPRSSFVARIRLERADVVAGEPPALTMEFERSPLGVEAKPSTSDWSEVLVRPTEAFVDHTEAALPVQRTAALIPGAVTPGNYLLMMEVAVDAFPDGTKRPEGKSIVLAADPVPISIRTNLTFELCR